MKCMKLLCSVFMVLMGMGVTHAQIPSVAPFNQIDVGYQTTTMLVFPGPIDKTDCGSADLLVKPDKKDGYVLKVKAAKAYFIPTNLTVFTRDGWMYILRIGYNENPPQLLYDCGGRDSLKAVKTLHDKSMNVVKIEQYAHLVAQFPYYWHYPKTKKGGMIMTFQKVFIEGDVLFFLFHITNYSNIPYDVQLTRFYTKDRQQRKRSSQMEQEIVPLYQYTTENQIQAGHRSSFVIAFNKFTISDHKYFISEILEKNGDRELRMSLTGKALLHATPF